MFCWNCALSKESSLWLFCVLSVFMLKLFTLCWLNTLSCFLSDFVELLSSIIMHFPCDVFFSAPVEQCNSTQKYVNCMYVTLYLGMYLVYTNHFILVWECCCCQVYWNFLVPQSIFLWGKMQMCSLQELFYV